MSQPAYKVAHMDITSITHGVIVHMVNCQRAMGSGVALALLKKWPDVYTQYIAGGAGAIMLGKCDWVDVTYQISVVNLYGQEFYGNDGKQYGNLIALQAGLHSVFETCASSAIPIYLPRIGCGLAGLDWDSQVGPIVDRLTTMYGCDVTVCDWP